MAKKYSWLTEEQTFTDYGDPEHIKNLCIVMDKIKAELKTVKKELNNLKEKVKNHADRIHSNYSQ